jgi:hypothetical protein
MKKDAGLRLQELIDEFGGLDECTRHRVQKKKNDIRVIKTSN